MKDQIDELTLLLLYLTSFKEDYGLGEAQRSWKGYPRLLKRGRLMFSPLRYTG